MIQAAIDIPSRQQEESRIVVKWLNRLYECIRSTSCVWRSHLRMPYPSLYVATLSVRHLPLLTFFAGWVA
jgi:hypothetical protein